jgi:glycosyltransferase involved in cell wall biosynthesis
MDQPRISLIIPFFNDEATLSKCLDSAIQQTLKDIEILCVDDASTDSSAEVVTRYARSDPRIRLLCQSSNSGQGAARNRGMESAQGDYVFHLDADDYLSPNALEHLLGVAEFDNVDITYGRITLFEKETGRIRGYRNDSRYVLTTVRRTTLNNFPSLVYAHNTLNRLYRRRFLLDHDIWFDTDPRWAEDVLFSLRSNFFAASITVSLQPTYYYRFGNYLSKATLQKCQDARDNLIRALRFIEARGEPPLIREMQRKQAIAASELRRPSQVLDRNGLLNYVPSLTPMVANTPDEIIEDLPSYPRRFAESLRSGNYEAAVSAWEKDREQPLPRWLDHSLVHRLKGYFPIWLKDGLKHAIWRVNSRG